VGTQRACARTHESERERERESERAFKSNVSVSLVWL
jgi:hypothetical protein